MHDARGLIGVKDRATQTRYQAAVSERHAGTASLQHRFGMWAASAALVASVCYGGPQLLQVAGVLVDPWDRILIFAPSLALAPAFVLTMVAVHGTAPAERQTYSLAALALAIMYGVMACIVYAT